MSSNRDLRLGLQRFDSHERHTHTMDNSIGIRLLKSLRMVGPMFAASILLLSLFVNTAPGTFGAAGVLALAGLLAHLHLVWLARHPEDE